MNAKQERPHRRRTIRPPHADAFGPRQSQAFTLIELLTVITIVAILAAGSFALYASATKRTNLVREISMGKKLMTAYSAYAADHDGNLIPGMDKSAGGPGKPVWFEPERRNITFMEAPHRYAFRLAPYFDYKVSEVLLANGLDKQINKIFGKTGGLHDYGISLCPTFGINYRFCGGYVEPSGALDYASQREALTRLNQAEGGAILVFASAGGRPDEQTYLPGYFKVDAPTAVAAPWSHAPWQDGANAADYGAVDARHDGKAVCAFLDGSVRALTIDELRDMRLWSRKAAAANDPTYTAEN